MCSHLSVTIGMGACVGVSLRGKNRWELVSGARAKGGEFPRGSVASRPGGCVWLQVGQRLTGSPPGGLLGETLLLCLGLCVCSVRGHPWRVCDAKVLRGCGEVVQVCSPAGPLGMHMGA